MPALLLVEDDASLGATLQERLAKEAYDVDWAQTKLQAQSFFDDSKYDLVILDVGLPDGTGFELSEHIKKQSNVPFIFVTAMGSAEYRLKGYELGAEEYIPKPFHLKELLIRVARVLESNKEKNNIQIGSFTIDLLRMSIIDKDNNVEQLSARDCKVLSLLIDRAPNVVSRDDILEYAWPGDNFRSNRTVDNCVVRLRQALDDSQATIIRTARGVGYQFIDWRK